MRTLLHTLGEFQCVVLLVWTNELFDVGALGARVEEAGVLAFSIEIANVVAGHFGHFLQFGNNFGVRGCDVRRF